MRKHCYHHFPSFGRAYAILLIKTIKTNVHHHHILMRSITAKNKLKQQRKNVYSDVSVLTYFKINSIPAEYRT